jgi:hypothetical protein
MPQSFACKTKKMPVAGLSALFTALEDVGEVCIQEE